MSWQWTAKMDENELIEQLEREGFCRAFVWEDRPNLFYPNHSHNSESAHIILSGELTLTMYGRAIIYRKGERCDVPAGAVHSAKTGPEGCRYLIGER
jgi:quercetin dioxygenase-like cupin family protein